MLRWVAAFCRPLRPVLLLVSFPRSRSPVVGVLGLCWMWRDVPFACQRRPPPPPPAVYGHCNAPLGGDPTVLAQMPKWPKKCPVNKLPFSSVQLLMLGQ